MRKTITLFSAVVLTSACDISVPVAAIDENGGVMKGTATAKASGEGTYTMTNGEMTCVGSYNALDMSLTIPLSILCDNGISGVGSATRTAGGQSGSGTFTTTDGRNWQFVFGQSVTSLF